MGSRTTDSMEEALIDYNYAVFRYNQTRLVVSQLLKH